MSREAMKLALEAFEVATTPLAKDRQEVLRAITALREALVEQPARPYRLLQDNGSKYFGESWDKAEQPAQRKPLTDEQLSAIGSKIFPSTWNIRHVELVRAIEAAHGIKENT